MSIDTKKRKPGFAALCHPASPTQRARLRQKENLESSIATVDRVRFSQP